MLPFDGKNVGISGFFFISKSYVFSNIGKNPGIFAKSSKCDRELGFLISGFPVYAGHYPCMQQKIRQKKEKEKQKQ